MKNKLIIEGYKYNIERIFHTILDKIGNYELKIIVNDEGYKVLKDNEELDNFFTINTLMALIEIFSLRDLENDLLDKQLKLFTKLTNDILEVRKECKNEKSS